MLRQLDQAGDDDKTHYHTLVLESYIKYHRLDEVNSAFIIFECVSLCYGVSLCSGVSPCYGVSPCHGVSPCYGVSSC